MDRECRQMRSVPSMFDTREENDVLYIEGYFSVLTLITTYGRGRQKAWRRGRFQKR